MRASTAQLRRRILAYVERRILAGDPPTVREVQEAFGFSAVESARQHLKALVEAGKLTQFSGRSRGYALARRSRSSRPVPILGRVQAGDLTTAIEDPDGFLELPLRRPDEEHFLLRVAGESMSGAGINPGDLLLVRRASVARHGAIVVALVDDEATVKRIDITPNKIKLTPENPNFAPIDVSDGDLHLLGVVIEVHRYLEGIPGHDG
jgi:repressor LexA